MKRLVEVHRCRCYEFDHHVSVSSPRWWMGDVADDAVDEC
jgi:hypothetical protein